MAVSVMLDDQRVERIHRRRTVTGLDVFVGRADVAPWQIAAHQTLVAILKSPGGLEQKVGPSGQRAQRVILPDRHVRIEQQEIVGLLE